MRPRVVTVGREFGCGSSEAARVLAQALGWRLFDGELLDETARRSHLDPSACRRTDERLDSWMHHLGKGLWNSSGEKGPALIPAGGDLDADRMAALTHRAIREIAAAGECVIVGRGGNYVLRQQPSAFHVFFYAPRHWRIRRLESQGQSAAAAAAMVDKMDRERAAYVRRYFGEDWPRRHFYHLLVNASLGQERVLEAIRAAMGA
ncbi:MAG: AAA family ATPase [Terriglobales bacterium]